VGLGYPAKKKSYQLRRSIRKNSFGKEWAVHFFKSESA